MNVEKLVETVMSKYKSAILYDFIQNALSFDENYHAIGININIVKKMNEIIHSIETKSEEFLNDQNLAIEFETEFFNKEKLLSVSAEELIQIKSGLQFVLDICEKNKSCFIKKNPTVLEFSPEDRRLFKKLLIEKKQAKRTMYYEDGRIETNYWNVRNFSYKSNLLVNIKNSPLFKNAQDNGILKICFEIENCDEETKQYELMKKRLFDMPKSSIIQLADEKRAEKKYSEAYKLYEKVRNIKLMEEVAEYCDGKIQLQLATMFENGISVGKNSKKAFKWYELAAENDMPEAQKKLAWMYSCGYGCDKNNKKAFEWYEKVAEHGEPEAQYIVGNRYYYGCGVWPGREFLKLKRKQWGNNVVSFLFDDALFVAYTLEYDCKRNIEKAIKYYEASAMQGNDQAQFMLGKIYYCGDGVSQDFKESIKWFECSSKQGNEKASLILGILYLKGGEVKQDYKKAFACFERIAGQGKKYAQLFLGDMYYYGYGVDKDFSKASEWYEKTAEQGVQRAQINLGLMNYNGEGVEQNYPKAMELFKQAAVGGMEERGKAEFYIGNMYYSGMGVERDLEWAFWSYKRSADYGYVNAFLPLANCYLKGEGVKKDFRKVRQIYQMAVQQSDADIIHSFESIKKLIQEKDNLI